MKLLPCSLLGRRVRDTVPGEPENQTYARFQAIAAEEEASLPYPCEKGCGAGSWQLCWSATGLPASAPCPERARGER